MTQLVELEKSMAALRQLAEIYVVNVDTPENSRMLKRLTGISVPVLLDSNALAVSRRYDMHARPGVPMGGMRGVPAMGFVIVDGRGIVRVQRSHLFFGQDAELMLKTLRSL
ncbi:MAG: redoxin domain-containing protein [Candidatus Lambdaproteobacteria bacterium]|nr:redoxin domain-containing protein [Candidatus Lambdaproteobacteria bacterium]